MYINRKCCECAKKNYFAPSDQIKVQSDQIKVLSDQIKVLSDQIKVRRNKQNNYIFCLSTTKI